MTTHNAIIARELAKWTEEQLATPTPGPDDVLVKVAYAALLPFDLEAAELGQIDPKQFLPHVPGLVFSGIVARVGDAVPAHQLSIGDRVAAFGNPSYGYKGWGMQQYAVLPRFGLAKIPQNIDLADAATVPDNFVTSWWTLSHHLNLPLELSNLPSSAPLSNDSILLYGASSTTGQYLLQVLALAGCTNVFAVASKPHHSHLRELGATHVFDYKEDDWTEQVVRANGGEKVKFAIDIIATDTTLRQVGQVVGADGKAVILLPMKFGHAKLVSKQGSRLLWELDDATKLDLFPDGTAVEYVRTFLYVKNEFNKENLMPKILPVLLEKGLIRPVKKVVIDEPADSLLARVHKGFDLIRENVVSGYKVLIKVD